MKGRSTSLRILVFFLLLGFSQKAGVGLLLHSLFHGSSSKADAKEHPDNKSISFGCSCEEDLSLPFIPGHIPDPGFIAKSSPVEFTERVATIPCTASPCFYLRGPPAAV